MEAAMEGGGGSSIRDSSLVSSVTALSIMEEVGERLEAAGAGEGGGGAGGAAAGDSSGSIGAASGDLQRKLVIDHVGALNTVGRRSTDTREREDDEED